MRGRLLQFNRCRSCQIFAFHEFSGTYITFVGIYFKWMMLILYKRLERNGKNISNIWNIILWIKIVLLSISRCTFLT